jgi:hypothetical protein
MLKPPKVPWPYRVGALTLALVAGLCTLQFYVAGAKFAGAVTNYARLAAQQSVKPKTHAAPEMANEPGIVPVMIIPKKETK